MDITTEEGKMNEDLVMGAGEISSAYIFKIPSEIILQARHKLANLRRQLRLKAGLKSRLKVEKM
jgi:hypothetical protein